MQAFVSFLCGQTICKYERKSEEQEHILFMEIRPYRGDFVLVNGVIVTGQMHVVIHVMGYIVHKLKYIINLKCNLLEYISIYFRKFISCLEQSHKFYST